MVLVMALSWNPPALNETHQTHQTETHQIPEQREVDVIVLNLANGKSKQTN